jgi:predicted nucleic acid-binding protein
VKRYLLDTNVVSELRKSKPHGAVLAWLRDLPADHMFVSAVTMGELQAGVELTRKQDPTKAGEIEAWVDQLVNSYQVLPMDTPGFRECARLMTGKSERLMQDGMIAATASIIHGLVVATRNERDFEQFQIEVLNPFQTQ